MTSTLNRPRAADTTVSNSPGAPVVPTKDLRGAKPASWLRRHGAGLAWLLPVLAIAAVVQAFNMDGSPQRIDDEGTYTAQAWAIQNLGEIAHYTYWYDHPPVGWLQISAYTALTGAFSRYDVAVLAAREAMLFFTIVSVVLVWLLGRKLGLSRPRPPSRASCSPCRRWPCSSTARCTSTTSPPPGCSPRSSSP